MFKTNKTKQLKRTVLLSDNNNSCFDFDNQVTKILHAVEGLVLSFQEEFFFFFVASQWIKENNSLGNLATKTVKVLTII